MLAALDRLRARFDVVVLEGAGSPAEINLLDGDLVNLWLADAAGIPAVVVGDIDRGGVFASLYGTVALLPDHLRRCVRAFVINKFRGDPALLTPGLADLEARTGVPTLGVLPWVDGLDLDAEDSLALPPARGDDGDAGPDTLDVAVVRFPRISNFTDFDALALEPAVSVRYVDHPGGPGRPRPGRSCPGTKATVADLAWLRARGFDERAPALVPSTTVLGICGGYQMLGRSIDDRRRERRRGGRRALGRLPAETRFEARKITRPRQRRRPSGSARSPATRSTTAGRVRRRRGSRLDDCWGRQTDGAAEPDGARARARACTACSSPTASASAFLDAVATRRGKSLTPPPGSPSPPPGKPSSTASPTSSRPTSTWPPSKASSTEADIAETGWVILFLSTADTEILALRAAIEVLPAGFPPVRAGSPAALDGRRRSTASTAVVVRLLGGRRAWEAPFDALRRAARSAASPSWPSAASRRSTRS